MKKRLLSIALTLAMLCTLVPAFSVSAGAATYGSASGTAIVNKAKEYVDKVPYVWGAEKIDGTNPQADCSGFVCRIYEKFGFDLWGYRTALRKYCVNLGTDLNKALPGDLLWYEGHIAIYAGKSGGKHMLVEETGGNISNVIYRQARTTNLKGVLQVPGVSNGRAGSTTMFYGKIHDADGYLSVNNQAKSTSKGAKQVGRIPNGQTCTVYTDKGKGNWWYVEYNGAKGYAYNNYITLTGAVGGSSAPAPSNPSQPPKEETPTASTMGVTFSLPTEATYKNKVKLYNTNAVMCNQITKKAGVKVTKMGMYLYDAKGSLLKQYTENVSGLVSDSNPRYHSWYDMNSEVGVTLTPGTTYKYQFFGVFNGVECKGPTYSFTTTGTAPVTPPSEPVTPPAPVEPPPVIETPEIPVVGGSVKVTHSEKLSGGVMVFTKDNISLNIDVEKPAGLGLQSLTFQVTDRSGQVVLRPTYYADELAKVTADTSFTASVRLFEAAPDYLTFGDTYYCQVVTKAETGQTFTGDTWTLRVEQEEQPPVLPSASLIELTINSQYMYVNGERQTIDAQGSRPQVNSDNRTILPVRAVFEAMGGTVGWNNDSRTVSLSLEGTTLYLKIDSYIMRDSQGNSYRMDTRPVIINGRTFLPIRPVVEYFGGDVGWNQNTQTVTIQCGN